jgi:hypothetical protein
MKGYLQLRFTNYRDLHPFVCYSKENVKTMGIKFSNRHLDQKAIAIESL